MKKLFYFLLLSTSFGLSAAAECPLHDALQALDLEKIDMAEVTNFCMLLEQTSNINEKDIYGNNLLHVLLNKKLENPRSLQTSAALLFLMNLLIEKGIDIDAFGFFL